MAKIIENDKGFKVIKICRSELVSRLAEFGAVGVCDSCNRSPESGYYIAVLNRWYCPECYAEWHETAKRYLEDVPYEMKNFEKYCRLFGLQPKQ